MAPKRLTRGMVLLYAITVFAIIASIGATIMDSGEYFITNVRTDYHMMVAQNAALSGVAYGEATIQRMLDLANGEPGPPAIPPRFEDVSSPSFPHVSMPAWAGRDFSGPPFDYAPLLGSQRGISSMLPQLPGQPGNPNTLPAPPNTDAWTMSYTVERRGNAESVRARFRIELRECSRPTRIPGYPAPPPPYVETSGNANPPGCADFLMDMNLNRVDYFWRSGSGFKPFQNPQAFGLERISDRFMMYTMRVEGEAVVRSVSGGEFDTIAARVVAKETWRFDEDVGARFEPIAFWYHDPARGY